MVADNDNIILTEFSDTDMHLNVKMVLVKRSHYKSSKIPSNGGSSRISSGIFCFKWTI